MSDDDLDLDLDDVPLRPVKPKAAPKPAAAEEPAKAKPAKVAGVPGPGLLERLRGYVRRPSLSGRTFLALLIALIALVLVIENWAPVRFYFLGLALELPKSIAFILNVAIGAAAAVFCLRRTSRPPESDK